MTSINLRKGKKLPDECHVARYCKPNSVVTVRQGSRRVVRGTAFIHANNPTNDLSFSVMERFKGSDERMIEKICKHRGGLFVQAGGWYVKLNVASIMNELYNKTNYYHKFLFKPNKRNRAHATLFNSGLPIFEALATLANREGELFPLPDPIPDQYEP